MESTFQLTLSGDEDDQLLNQKEAATLLGRTRQSLNRSMACGAWPDLFKYDRDGNMLSAEGDISRGNRRGLYCKKSELLHQNKVRGWKRVRKPRCFGAGRTREDLPVCDITSRITEPRWCWLHDFVEDTHRAKKNSTATNPLRIMCKVGGVYALWRGDVCVYVGKSRGTSTGGMTQRVLQHVRHYNHACHQVMIDAEKQFTDAIEEKDGVLVLLPHNDPDKYEIDVIREWNPTHNRMSLSSHTKVPNIDSIHRLV